jgi:hypothetical protein
MFSLPKTDQDAEGETSLPSYNAAGSAGSLPGHAEPCQASFESYCIPTSSVSIHADF